MALRRITTRDVAWACDLLRPVQQIGQVREQNASDGVGGRVSIDVDLRAAHDTEKTVAKAHRLRWLVDRPNPFIKIPATTAGCRPSRSAWPRTSAST